MLYPAPLVERVLKRIWRSTLVGVLVTAFACTLSELASRRMISATTHPATSERT